MPGFRRQLALTLSDTHGAALRDDLQNHADQQDALDAFEDAVDHIWRDYRRRCIRGTNAAPTHKLYNFWDGLMTTDTLEHLDIPETPPHITQRILDQLARWNDLSGFNRRLLHTLTNRLKRTQHPPRILEIGCGEGNLSRALARWARDTHHPLDITATDLHPETVEAAEDKARSEGLDIKHRPLNALDMAPFGEKSFDLAICVQTMHHLSPGKLARALYEAHRVAHDLFMVDLARLPGLHTLTRAAFPLLYDEAFTHDALLSLRRAYSRSDLTLIGGLAIGEIDVDFMPPFHTRLSL